MSDTSDRNFVLIMFIVVYIYMLNIQSRISLKNDWDNTKCNPLNLFTSSFYQSEQESYNQFGNCIKQFSKGVAKSELSSMVNVQNDEFEKVSNLANKNMNRINNTLKEKTRVIDKNYKETNKNIDNTTSYLNTIKSYEATIPNKIEDLKNEVKNIFSRISTYMNKS
jgi:archaellum component FlaC